SPIGSTASNAGVSISPLRVEATPNPFRTRAEFAFDAVPGVPVELSIYDVRGRLVAPLLQPGRAHAGRNIAAWEPSSNQPSGVYWYRLRTPSGMSTGRIVLAR